MRAARILTTTMTSLLMSAFAEARPLNSEALYQRCYAFLTQQRAPAKDPGRLAVRNGADPISQCLEIFTPLSLAADGFLNLKDDSVARKVLAKFHDFHRSWLGSTDFEASESDVFRFMTDVYDPAEPSLHLTRALFAPGVHYREVLTRRTSLQALRDANRILGFPRPSQRNCRATDASCADLNNDFLRVILNPIAPPPVTNLSERTEYFFTDANNSNVSIPLVQVGGIVGIRDQVSFSIDGHLVYPSPTLAFEVNTVNPPTQQNIFQNFGGGAIGSASYLLTHFGHGLAYRSEGVLKLPRRWAKAVVKDFLCRELPVLREADVLPLMREDTSAPFRKAPSCLRCHGTMDRMAMTLRNLVFASPGISELKRSTLMFLPFTPEFQAGQDELFWPAHAAETFHLQNPEGLLAFRSHSGRYIETKVNNLQELGEAITATEDYYICAAKRYFQHFTGINLPLFDRFDATNVGQLRAETATQGEIYNFIIDQGRRLQADGSLKNLVERLLRSVYFRQTYFIGGS